MKTGHPGSPGPRRAPGWAVASLAWGLAGLAALPFDARAMKSTSGVLLQAEVPTKVRVGQMTTLTLQVSGVTSPAGATLEVRRAGQRDVLFAAHLRSGERRMIEVPFVPAADGLQYVDVITRQGSRSSVQSVAIPVGSGRVSHKPGGARVTTPTGETLISLPARSAP